jgi:hypothetical protein
LDLRKKTIVIPLKLKETLFNCTRNCTSTLGDVQTVASEGLCLQLNFAVIPTDIFNVLANRSVTEDGEHVEYRESPLAVSALRDRGPADYGCNCPFELTILRFTVKTNFGPFR